MAHTPEPAGRRGAAGEGRQPLVFTCSRQDRGEVCSLHIFARKLGSEPVCSLAEKRQLKMYDCGLPERRGRKSTAGRANTPGGTRGRSTGNLTASSLAGRGLEGSTLGCRTLTSVPVGALSGPSARGPRPRFRQGPLRGPGKPCRPPPKLVQLLPRTHGCKRARTRTASPGHAFAPAQQVLRRVTTRVTTGQSLRRHFLPLPWSSHTSVHSGSDQVGPAPLCTPSTRRVGGE